MTKASSDVDERSWKPTRHEAKVERVYETAARRGWGDDRHGGFLNTGYWSYDTRDYREAMESLVREMGSLLALTPQSHVLDVACGAGGPAVFLHEAFGARVDAVDVSRASVERARARAARARCAAFVVARHGSGTQLPFADGAFSHVLCIEGADHMSTRFDFLVEARRVLAPGGSLGLAECILKRKPRTLLESTAVELARILSAVPKVNVQVLSTYRATLEEAGYESVHVVEAGQRTLGGYYAWEAANPEASPSFGRCDAWINRFLSRAYANGLLEFVLARATKPLSS